MNPQYIRDTLKAAGYRKVDETPCVLRLDDGIAVNGIIFDAKEK